MVYIIVLLQHAASVRLLVLYIAGRCPCSRGFRLHPSLYEDSPGNVNFLTFYYCCRDNPGELATVLNFDYIRRFLPASFVFWSKGGSCQPIRDRTVVRGSLKYESVGLTSPSTFLACFAHAAGNALPWQLR